MESEKYMKDHNNGKALDEINKAIKLNPNEPNYYRQRAKVGIASTLGTDAKTKQKLKSLIEQDLETSLSLNTKNLATIRNNVQLYFFLANLDLSQPASPSNTDPLFLPNALEYFEFVKKYAPTDLGVQVHIAKYEKRLQAENYKTTLETIRKIRPDVLEWHPDIIQ